MINIIAPYQAQRLVPLYALALLVILNSIGQAQPNSKPAYMSLSQPTCNPSLDPDKTVGFQSCLKCHAAEAAVWSTTWHQTSITSLHRSAKAKEIAAKLGLQSIKYSDRCVKCHYTPVNQNGSVFVSAAVSCECCHGAGSNWWNNHFPAESTVATETPEQREQRIARNLRNGMRNRHNTFTMARICMRCHNVRDEELVNVAGHSVGGSDFEMVSWSQGLMRHRFVSGGGERNAPNSQQRLAMIFVSGIIADLEFSLRATANATSNDRFGQQVARRADTAARRLASVESKTNIPLLSQILSEFKSVQLRANNREALETTAENIRVLGVRFGAEHDGQELVRAIGPYVPKPRDWIFE